VGRPHIPVSGVRRGDLLKKKVCGAAFPPSCPHPFPSSPSFETKTPKLSSELRSFPEVRGFCLMARGRGRGRKRRRGRNAAPDPSSAAPPGDLTSSSTAGARLIPPVAYDPLPVVPTDGSAVPVREDSSSRYDDSPPPVGQQGPAVPSRPSPIPSERVTSPPCPLLCPTVAARLHEFNYAGVHSSLENRFYEFLT
jgi:hypothetical protein